MSAKTIPEQVQYTCDICQKVCDPHGPAKRKQQARVEMRASGEWTSEGWAMDLCDGCKLRVDQAIDTLRKESAT